MKTTRVTCPRCLIERTIKGARDPVGMCRPCALDVRFDERREARFWANVEKTTDCWLWRACHNRDGYGLFAAHRGRGSSGVHRYAYELLVGPIPHGLEIDHLCRNRGCVNPEHLEPVTRHENWRRGRSFSVVNAEKTHCPRGHAYDAENTYHLPSGSRWCRTCKRAEGRAYLRRKRAANERRNPAGPATKTFSLPGGVAA